MAELLIIALLFAALVGLVFCWAEWRKQLRHIGMSSWRKAGLTFGLFAATSQALLFVYTWTPLSRFHHLLREAMKVELLLFVLVIPCIFAWWGSARWWLLTASIGFSAGHFFSMLAEVAY